MISGSSTDVETDVDELGGVAEVPGTAATGAVDDICEFDGAGVLLATVAVGCAPPQADTETSIASTHTLAAQRDRVLIKVVSMRLGPAGVRECAGKEDKVNI